MIKSFKKKTKVLFFFTWAFINGFKLARAIPLYRLSIVDIKQHKLFLSIRLRVMPMIMHRQWRTKTMVSKSTEYAKESEAECKTKGGKSVEERKENKLVHIWQLWSQVSDFFYRNSAKLFMTNNKLIHKYKHAKWEKKYSILFLYIYIPDINFK